MQLMAGPIDTGIGDNSISDEKIHPIQLRSVSSSDDLYIYIVYTRNIPNI